MSPKSKKPVRESEVTILERALKVAEAAKHESEARRAQIETLEAEAERASKKARMEAERLEAPFQKKISELRRLDDSWSRQKDVDKAKRMLSSAKDRQHAREDKKRIMNMGKKQ